MNNTYIKDYIEYYLSLTTEPQYAIMLKGAWGSGKTWFIEQVLEEYKQKNSEFKFLKVSLYGVNSIKQIEDEFYRQLHPVLSNKALIFGANVLKNTLKATFKIDLNGDNKSDVDVNTNVPTINLNDFSRKPDGFVLVFDDIERAGIDLPILFGYINHFVEVNGYKAILVANEEEIINREKRINNDEKSSSEYMRTKEKLVGKTFEVTSDLHSACNVFLGVISSLHVANIFKEDMQAIEDIYVSAKYNNLRHLRQFFLDVQRIISLLGNKYVSNDDFMRVFFQQLLIFSIEYRGGNLNYEDFDSISNVNYGMFLGKERTKTKYDMIVEKYSSPVLTEKLLDGAYWRELICDGKVTSELLAQLDITRFFRSTDAQAWEYLWNYRELNETMLNEQYAIAKDNLFSGKITSLGELLMTASILLDMAKEGLTTDDVHDLINETKQNINNYYNRLRAEDIHKEYAQTHYNELRAWRGFGFLDRDSDEFKLIIEHIEIAKKKRFDESIPEFALQFSDELQRGNLSFVSELSHSNNRQLNLHNVPFLHLVPPEVFIESYRKLDPVLMRKLAFSLRNRYSDGDARTRLTEEYNWLINLKEIAVDFTQNAANNSFQVFHVKFFIDYVLTSAIKFFTEGTD
ncbi:TPA: NTPase KAP [Escherichia coli]|uniref:P-loop NTPase fold protein n=1 Tax=Escherichia coli TaxID=562 RepID=UPI000BB72D05|nr:P-loop NTPase fold protein [Escherichia coli]EFL0124758.1 NTPase KAP [Escherichia coli]MBC1156041.1 NTPase KAP [Escherichia coli]MCA7648342.1 KAP family NTPase [Escherichia coli]WBZ78585.1 P-loop NTPase fold protein [Escherichia coli]HBD0158515.1 NTPase KAP [Escherichia coli]